jgi:hypothetical protein
MGVKMKLCKFLTSGISGREWPFSLSGHISERKEEYLVHSDRRLDGHQSLSGHDNGKNKKRCCWPLGRYSSLADYKPRSLVFLVLVVGKWLPGHVLVYADN